jgi:hypothetical protein
VDPLGHDKVLPCPWNKAILACDENDWIVALLNDFYKSIGIDTNQYMPTSSGTTNVAGAITNDLLKAGEPGWQALYVTTDAGLNLFPGAYQISQATSGTNLLGEQLSPLQRLEAGLWGMVGFCGPMFSPNAAGGGSAGWGTEAEFWAGRNAYEAEVRGIPARAYAKMATGEFGIENAEKAAAEWATAERRLLGIKYKNMTVPKILEEIYRRNLDAYGDKLGPTMEYFVTEKRYSFARIIESSGKPGGRDIITWVVENTGWDIKKWVGWIK